MQSPSLFRRLILPALLISGISFVAVLVFWQPGVPATGADNGSADSESFGEVGLNAAEPVDPTTYTGGPIVIELFTSQGCSSCPPADRVLSLLRQTGQIDGIPIVTLSEHVDYWNRLGWKDPYSKSVFSDRQAAYARAINRSNRIYTPQMVVDGREEFVGHNLRRATEAVRKAAARNRIPLKLTVIRSGTASSGSALKLEAVLQVLPSAKKENNTKDLAGLSRADVIIAISEDGLGDQVKRGENAGHTLRHDGVIRKLISSGPLKSESDIRTVALDLAPEWKTEQVRIVAWLQEQDTRAILGAAMASVPAQ